MRITNEHSTGIGFIGCMQILFIALKLCKVIDWSWWWVLSPLWISTGLFLLLLIAVLIYRKFNR